MFKFLTAAVTYIIWHCCTAAARYIHKGKAQPHDCPHLQAISATATRKCAPTLQAYYVYMCGGTHSSVEHTTSIDYITLFEIFFFNQKCTYAGRMLRGRYVFLKRTTVIHGRARVVNAVVVAAYPISHVYMLHIYLHIEKKN